MTYFTTAITTQSLVFLEVILNLIAKMYWLIATLLELPPSWHCYMLIFLLFFAIALLAAVIEAYQSWSQLSEFGGWIETSLHHRILESLRKTIENQHHECRLRNMFTSISQPSHQFLCSDEILVQCFVWFQLHSRDLRYKSHNCWWFFTSESFCQKIPCSCSVNHSIFSNTIMSYQLSTCRIKSQSQHAPQCVFVISEFLLIVFKFLCCNSMSLSLLNCRSVPKAAGSTGFTAVPASVSRRFLFWI